MNAYEKRLREAGLPETDLAAVLAAETGPLLFATVSGAHLYGFPFRDSAVASACVRTPKTSTASSTRHRRCPGFRPRRRRTGG